jgi:dipeptidase D
MYVEARRLDAVAAGTSDRRSVLDDVEPVAFWRRFEELTKIARPSRHEERVIDYVRSWAADRGLELAQDGGRNLVIRVRATPGRESAPVLVLQGHLDMVCERDPASANDPAEGRIALLRNGDWLTADGTTLGADDGIAIAAMMTLVEDASIRHGPLELLMTVAEEVGLEGANALDGSLLTGRTLMNLDSEEDGTLTVGCAGSTDTWIRVEGPRAAAAPGAVTLAVVAGGGLGGHSGSEIHLGRVNAIKLLGRVLREAYAGAPFGLVSLSGGKSRNAIPRDAVAVCSVPASREPAFRAAIETATATVHDAFSATDPGAGATVEPAEASADPWTEEATERLLDVLALVPTGPLAMSPDFEGLVETSTSLGEASTDGNLLTLHSLSRSSNDSALPEVIATLAAAARLGGGALEIKHNYNGWRPDMQSRLLAVASAASERLFGKPPKVSAIHAGLETAVIGTKVSGHLDMLAIGPQIEAPHSPDERVSIPTAGRFWKLLVAVVDDLSTTARES